MRLNLLVILLVISSFSLYGGRKKSRLGTTKKYAVEVAVVVAEKPPYSITLNWTSQPAFSYIIYRRFLGEKQWQPVPVAVLDGKAVTFVDKNIKQGIAYEYRIDRVGKGYIGRGYICAGIDLPVVDNRGRVILLVDNEFAGDLENELKRLELDLIGDGWCVSRYNVDRKMTVQEVKEVILKAYRESPDTTKAVFLFGQIPVPYSGNIFPDGHTNHRGAWPADLYYGDVDGEWTDKDTKKYHLRWPKQYNVPNDGKFDQSTLPPDSIELAVGRVDLSGMTQFPQNETELMRQYLNKNHYFRHGYLSAGRKGLIDDNFGGFRGEAFGSDGLRSFSAFFGSQNVDDLDWFTTLPEQSYLWAYGCGGGSNQSANGVGKTMDFVKSRPKAVFTMLFGSYFGDWNHANNFLRAPLASSGYALTCCWAGRPHWYLHHMGGGKHIGYSVLRTQNNHAAHDYVDCQMARKPGKDNRFDSEWSYNSIHVALMGDPTLRMHVVKPPYISSVTLNDNILNIHWEPAADKDISGYHVYGASDLDSGFKRITDKPLQTCEYSIQDQKINCVMVKAVKVEQGGSGSYINTSQGVFAKRPQRNMFYQATKFPRVIESDIEEDHTVNISQLVAGDTDNVKCAPTSLTEPDIKCLSAFAPERGTVSYKNGSMLFSPELDANGLINVNVIPWDGLNDCKPIDIKLNLLPVADAPRIHDQQICVPHLGMYEFMLEVYDPDSKAEELTYKIVTQPQAGSLSGEAPNMVYQLTDNSAKESQFTFSVSDGMNESQPAIVRLIPPLQCVKASSAKIIDGMLNDWGEFSVACQKPTQIKQLEKVDSWRGKEDCSFFITTEYDDKNLYIAVKVLDDQFNAVKNKSPWNQDGIEVRLDARPLKLRSNNRGKGEMKDFLLVAMSPSPSQSEKWVYKQKKIPKDIQYACVRNKEGFNCEIVIPHTYLNEKAGNQNWTGFRLNVCVNDRDDDGQVQLWWKPDWRGNKTYKNSGSFSRMK